MNLKNLFLLVVLAVLALSFFRLLGRISEGKKRLVEVKDRVAQVIQRKEDLEGEVTQKGSLSYLEREARDRLNLIKPGERIVILPQAENFLVTESAAAEAVGSSAERAKPNWQKWWELFFD